MWGRSKVKRDKELAREVGEAVREALGVPEPRPPLPPSVIALLARKRVACGAAPATPGSLRAVQIARFDKWIAAECEKHGIPVPE
jgi:hypothetical protein